MLPPVTLTWRGTTMWKMVLQLLATGCWHRHLSQPFSPRPPRNLLDSSLGIPILPPYRSETYVVCLDCGRHFDYDWARMRLVK